MTIVLAELWRICRWICADLFVSWERQGAGGGLKRCDGKSLLKD